MASKAEQQGKEACSQKTEDHNWHQRLSKSNDFVHEHTSLKEGKPFWLSYYRTLISSDILHQDVLPFLQEQLSMGELKSVIPVQEIIYTKDPNEIIQNLMRGYLALQKHEHDEGCILINIANSKFRDVSITTMEASAIGPQIGFIEELDTNINLIRKRLPVPELLVIEMKVGELSKTNIAVIYMDGIADPENVNTVENGDKVVLDNLYSKAHYQVKIKNGRPEFTINLKMKASLQEFTSPKKKRGDIDRQKIQKELGKHLKGKALKIIEKFKKRGVDPLGLGAKYKEHYRGFNQNQWNTYYPTTTVRVNVKIDIKQTGIVK